MGKEGGGARAGGGLAVAGRDLRSSLICMSAKGSIFGLVFFFASVEETPRFCFWTDGKGCMDLGEADAGGVGSGRYLK